MNLIQRHITEWQQISNMRASMQNTGYGDAQLQLQTLQIQMQLQSAWNQIQQDSDGASQRQTFQINNDQNAMNPPNQAAASSHNDHFSSQPLSNARQGTARSENSQDISAWLPAILNNENANQTNMDLSTNYQATCYSSQGPASSENVDFSTLFAALQNNNSASLNTGYGQTTSRTNQANTSLFQQMQSRSTNQQPQAQYFQKRIAALATST
jgi:hypothetical protein